jgi:Lecithin retinol acyltransferase
MQYGDHLVTPRVGYTHHGIYIGNGKVIHYGGIGKKKLGGSIRVSTLQEFSQGHGYRVKKHWFRRYSPHQTVERAYSRMRENKYNVLLNNCEQFVTWCLFGVCSSSQINRIVLTLTMSLGVLRRVLR